MMSLTQAFVLHQRPYRETSLLLDVISRDYGRVSLVARGVRQKRKRGGHQLQLFQPLWLSWVGRGELQTLTDVEHHQPRYWLKGHAALCGLYINELLIRLTGLHQSEPMIFDAYQQALSELEHSDSCEITLRIFEKHLLAAMGYGLALTHEASSGLPVTDDNYYRYLPEHGLIVSDKAIPGQTISGRSLRHFEQESDFDLVSLSEIKQMMRTVLNYYLDGKPLKSRQLFAQMQLYANPATSETER
ncbi:DNA repair protein [Methylophaga lonarensis MPL]|uniref:DNA repair protein RecO n=1 Tax=Methylophaga lonarensis MPL TaxID=1286106 RepID=M7NUM5_9GAMM|nr:DNA repair protein RecO [Methylophaga lonarensis]EMR12488.1 DNA repair protein [Methylophaga lonarensis MPL]